jgi:hypothetical protein
VLRSDEALKLNLDALARADMKSRYDAYAVGITNSVLSPNEARASEGRPPVKGGDKLWRQMNLEELDAPDVEPPATEPPATDPPETDPPDPETPPTDEATK